MLVCLKAQCTTLNTTPLCVIIIIIIELCVELMCFVFAPVRLRLPFTDRVLCAVKSWTHENAVLTLVLSLKVAQVRTRTNTHAHTLSACLSFPTLLVTEANNSRYAHFFDCLDLIVCRQTVATVTFILYCCVFFFFSV